MNVLQIVFWVILHAPQEIALFEAFAKAMHALSPETKRQALVSASSAISSNDVPALKSVAQFYTVGKPGGVVAE